jgi:hypothetical protein
MYHASIVSLQGKQSRRDCWLSQRSAERNEERQETEEQNFSQPDYIVVLLPKNMNALKRHR